MTASFHSCGTFPLPNEGGESVELQQDGPVKKNQNTPRPSEHPPVMGEKMSKHLGGIKRLQLQNVFMAFKQVPRCR